MLSAASAGAATARISAGAARDCSSRDKARLVSTTLRHLPYRRAGKAPIASEMDLLSETHWPSTTPSSIAMPPPIAMWAVVAWTASPIRSVRPRDQGWGTSSHSNGRQMRSESGFRRRRSSTTYGAEYESRWRDIVSWVSSAPILVQVARSSTDTTYVKPSGTKYPPNFPVGERNHAGSSIGGPGAIQRMAYWPA